VDSQPSSFVYAFLSLHPHAVAFDVFVFLRRQENEAGTPAQWVFGGVRELVQPSDGFSQSVAQPEPHTLGSPSSNRCQSGSPNCQLVSVRMS